MHVRYNLETDTWIELAPMPMARRWPHCEVIRKNILAMGGSDADGNQLTLVEYYDPLMNKWFAASPMLAPRRYFNTGVSNGIVYVMGGREPETDQIFATIDKYSIQDDNWTRVSSIYEYCIKKC